VQSALFAQQRINSKIPGIVNFSGVITDSNGKIVLDGKYNLEFSLYTESMGGDAVWSEQHSNVVVLNGEINVQLGNGSDPNPLNLKFDRKYFLGIKLNDNQELSPRIELLPTPYSLRTNIAQVVRDSSITAQKIVPLSVTDDKIKSISWDKIKNLPPVKLKPEAKISSPTKVTDLPVYWRRYANYLETGNEFLGTVNDRNLVIKTDSVQRMLFDPYGKVQMGTVEDSVFFEVIGKTTLGNVYVKNRAGVGVTFPDIDAKLEINSKGTQSPFRVDYDGNNIFNINNKGRVEINSTLTGGEDAIENYPLTIEGVNQGMAIKINGSSSNSNSKYMTFWDDAGIAGRIEGMDALDYFGDAKNIAHDVWIAAQAVAVGVAIAMSALEAPDIVQGTAQLIYEAFVLTWNLTHLGVSYQSSSADYAEWLEKLNPDEIMSPGDIVGVFGGKISKRTKGANHIMSISLSPAVLGNMPDKGKEDKFEKVAFKGQVPVKVIGTVNKGDYIIPSGLGDGIGIAVAPQLMTASEFSVVLGKAWEPSKDNYLNMINVAVGLKLKDLALYIKERLNNNSKFQNQLAAKDQELDSMILLLNELNDNYQTMQKKLSVLKKYIGEDAEYSIHRQNKQESILANAEK
jgi:hypothetical protein